MKTVMILAISQKVCNIRLFSIGMMVGRGACFVMAALVSLLMTGALRADTHYVNVVRPDDSGDGLSWAMAEKTIQAAITASTAGDTIVVTNGVYASITTTNNSITIQSVNGANVTIIDGGGTNSCTILGSSESDTNTILVGFTLRNGSFYYGGGSCFGTLNTCTLTGNSASFDGGGSYYGTLNNCTLTGNSASYGGGGSYYGTLNNCTLTGNSAYSGGGAYCGTLNNCTLTCNSASDRGGGSYYGTLNNCTLTGNSASSEGGGSYDCILYNCMLKGNSAYSGGGANCGTLNNCTLTGNSASYGGGGAWEGTLNNCMLTGNSASDLGGGSCLGTLNNCTLTGNRASSGGGSYECTLINCIVWGNTHISGLTNNYSWGTFSYSCTAPLPSGPGNVSVDPFFRLPAAGDFRLSHGSPCLNTGTNGYVVGAMDVFGNARIQDGTVDMGACEGAWTLMTDGQHLVQNISAIGGGEGISVSWGPPADGRAILYRVCRMEMLTGQWTPISGWISGGSFLDTQVFGGVACRYAIVTAFDTQLDVISGLSKTAEGQRYLVPLYVDAVRPDDAGDGRSWLTAKKTIQAAISTSAPYDTIFVTNGVYSPFLTSNKLLAIQSVNGASVTIIDGGGTNRCATLGSTLIHLSTFLNGFTLCNGYASEGAGSCYGTLNNCTLTGNIATDAGGGSHGGALNNCTLTGNTAFFGGGSYYGTLNNCTLTGNSASTYGGGVSRGTLNNCTLTGNSAVRGGGSYSSTLNNCSLTGNSASHGGGAYWDTLNNCTLAGNSASTYGGGALDGLLNNCTLTGNIASTSGGGAYLGTLNNCTLTGNSATYSGGGVSHGTLNNCIVWGNTLASGLTNNYLVGTFRYSCTTPLPSGTGNISNYPLFQDEVNSNFMLRAESPCINSGSNAFVVGTTDLLGNPRIVAGRVDMGAYEMPPTVTVTFDANGGLLATGQTVTNRVGFSGDRYDSWLSLSNWISRVGYTINGWFTAPTGGVLVLSNHTITAGRIYAQWMANNYDVTLDWQNGMDVTLTNVLYGQAYQLPPAVFADATFLGWWTLPNGMGTAILPETVVSATSNHMLHAQWDVNSVVGTTGLVWQTEGDSLWFVQTNAVTQGLSAMRSGVISDDQASWIGTTVTGPGQFSFWWRVSSEGGYDELTFAVNGVENRVISGTKKDGWQVVEVMFTNAGPHELRWTYSKDDSASSGLDCGWLDRVAWIPAPPSIPGNPNVSSNFLDNVTQTQVDALVEGLRAAHPDVTDAEIAKKFEDADLFGFTGAALVSVGTDALARFTPSILLVTLSVSDGDPKTLVVAVTMGNNIDPTHAAALARIGEAINSRMRGIFKNSLSAGASESLLTPMLSLDSPSGVVTATFKLENPSATSGFLRMSLRK